MSELRDLLERAAYDLRQGWPEAAYDCIGRALRLLEARSHIAKTATTVGTIGEMH